MSKKLYKGLVTTDGTTGSRRLVRASNQAQAYRYLSKDLVSVSLATAEDVNELKDAGVVVEDAVESTRQAAE